MTMSIILALKGYSITLFEAMDSIGGALRYGIPEFRLPKSILDLYRKTLDSLEIKFRPNTRIGINITTEDMSWMATMPSLFARARDGLTVLVF